jgi:hypothetical protein
MTASFATNTTQASEISRRDLLTGALVFGFAAKNTPKACAIEPNVPTVNGTRLDSASENQSFAPNGFIAIGPPAPAAPTGLLASARKPRFITAHP